jgi:hypothetical protein
MSIALHHFDDSNYQQLVRDPRAGGAPPDMPVCAAANIRKPTADEFKLIDEDEWQDRIEEADANKTWAESVERGVGKIPVADQDGTNYCWVFSLMHAMEYQRLRQGLPYVHLAAVSVGGPVSGWRNVGGYPVEAMQYAVEHGMAPIDYVSDEHSTRQSNMKAGWQTAALDYRVQEWWDLSDMGFAGIVTAALLGLVGSSGHAWWSHAICSGYRIKYESGQYWSLIRNNWGAWEDDGFAWLSRSKSTPDIGFVVPRLVRPT